jgi:uncharacterized tellurite resistance protein B-like protein
MIDLFTADFNSLTNDDRYSAVVDFAKAQPTESNRHDFKLVWNNDTLKDVAAFANTFGGILIIGVEKNQSDTQAKVIGVTSTSELMTGIASSIATNISPTPFYDIMECYKPDETNKRFCVVRIRSDATLYLVTKKDISPAWVRNADQTVRADAAQLRRLIERERQLVESTNEILLDRASKVLEEMVIGYSYAAELQNWTAGSWKRSDAYFKLALIPKERRWMPLDVRQEHKFVTLIHEHYRRVRSNLGGAIPVANDAQNRSADFYEYRWYHKNLDYEGRWRITEHLDFAHATQVKDDNSWSLLDIVVYTILLLRVAGKWWKTFNYFGDGILFADLSVGTLQPMRGKSGQFLKLFGPGEGDFAMRADVLMVHPQQRTESQAYIGVNSATIIDNIPLIVTSLMNPLLRSLGHAVLWAEFEDNVRVIASGMAH